jgi:DNA-binding Lrp family transcriptional regulator
MPNTQTAILSVLTCNVRLATTEQLATLTGLPTSTVFRQLRKLEASGWLESARVAIRRPKLDTPIFTWQPAQPTPNFSSLAYKLDSRWASLEPTPCHLWWTTPLAVAEFGGVGGRIKQPTQVEHDLAVAEVYLKLGAPSGWKMEDLFDECEFGTKIPDAALTDEDGTLCVIEIGGQYAASRIEAFHKAMKRVELPYELW